MTEEENASRDESVAALKARLKSKEEWQAAFLQSKEYKQVVDDQTYS